MSDHEMRTLTPEVAEFYATSLGDVFTPNGNAGVIEAVELDWASNACAQVVGAHVVGAHVDQWFYVDELDYNHTEYLRVVAMREREGY